MSLIPSFFGGQRNSSVFDPSPSTSGTHSRTSTFIFPPNFLGKIQLSQALGSTGRRLRRRTCLPGLKNEEVKVEVEDDRVLQISGERRVEKEDKNDTWHRIEQRSGRFQRRFKLSENAKRDQIKASMENGVLTVPVPKMKAKKPDLKAIEISD